MVINMNLNILLNDFIDTQGIMKTYRFVPLNKYNKVVVDRLEDIYLDIKGSTDKNAGLLRIYNSDKCQLTTATCRIKDFIYSDNKIHFIFEYKYIPVGSSREGNCGIYNLVLPVGFRLVKLYVADPFDTNAKSIKKKKQFKYEIFYDNENKLQIVQIKLLSRRGSFSFIVDGTASIDSAEREYLSYQRKRIKYDDDIDGNFFDDGVKNTFWKSLLDAIILEPNFYGIGINLKNFIKNVRGK